VLILNRTLTARCSGAAPSILLLVGALCAPGAAAQTAATGAPPAFEVVSIHEAPAITPLEAMSKRLSRVNVDGARADLGFQSLTALVMRAFRMESYQISAPGWMATTRFDIAAKLPEGASTDQAPEMLQTMLKERFKLSLHRDTREFSVYVLAVGKDGLKLKTRPADYQRVPGNSPIPRTMAILAAVLSSQSGLNRPVVDQTGLKGEYLMNMEDLVGTFSAYTASLRTMLTEGAPADSASEPSGPGTFRLLESWGLKLEARKLPLPVLVIDHIEKIPTEN